MYAEKLSVSLPAALVGFIEQYHTAHAIKSRSRAIGEIIQPTTQETAAFHHLTKLHRAPFDRMIIWQAIQQPLVPIPKDKGFPQHKKFGLKVLW